MNKQIVAKEISFLDLFRHHHYQIRIPSIQRDYAQGRTSEKATKIRRDFVQELSEFLQSEQSHSLDFIYGDVEGEEFIPLDGQQRLTTLWLLHLYLGGLAGENCSDLVFSYETRDSSTRFCRSLLSHVGELFNKECLKKEFLVDAKKKKYRKIQPSELIQNEGWWYRAWMTDPTVSGMLTMLDEIDRKFYDIADLAYHNLFHGNVPPVVFEFLPLKGFHDIDDLYIKMNARGLPLTEFEIFKSKLIEDVETHLPDLEKAFKADIDVKWSDALWRFRDYDGNPNRKNVDLFLERALKVILANESPLASNHDWKAKELDCLFEANDREVTFAHNWYERKGVVFEAALLRRVIEDLKTLFNPETTALSETNYAQYDARRFDMKAFVKKWILPENGQDKNLDLTYDARLKLHAFLHFLQQMPHTTEDELAEWMRLVYNLAIARRINNSEEMVKALKDVETLLADYKKCFVDNARLSINEWVAHAAGWTPRYFEQFQWAEERCKAQLRCDGSWRKLIEQAEYHPYLRGQIGFTLYLSDYISDHTPLPEFQQIPDSESYREILAKVLPLFDVIGDPSSVETRDYLMVKALLSKGDYMPWSSSYRKNFHNSPAHRDYSWKNLFLITDHSNKAALRALKAVVNHTYFQPTDIQESLKAIVAHHTPQVPWIEYLLGDYGKALMDISHQGFIAFDYDNEHENILIYHQSQRNHYHSEFMTRVLYEELKSKYNLKPDYQDAKSEAKPCIVQIRGLEIVHWNDTWYVDKSGEKETYTQMLDVIQKILSLPES